MSSRGYASYGSGSFKKKAVIATSLLVTSGSGIAGSGGSYTSALAFESQLNTTSIDLIINPNQERYETKNKVIQQLDFIKDVFSLTDEELTRACNISSRKTLFNWKESGNISRDNNRQRVFDLFLLAQDWSEHNYPNNKDAITRGVLNGQSVLDILQEDYLDKQKALFAGRRLLRQSLTSNSTILL